MRLSLGNYAWFYIGTSGLAFIVGMLTGVSASPVVAIVMPLLFALLSAGGGIYVILGKDDESGVSPRSRASRAGFLGKQLASFSLGILAGVWCGVWAKLHSDTLWARKVAPMSAVVDIPFSKPNALAGLLELDRRLQDAQVPFEQRKVLLGKLHAEMMKRGEAVAASKEKDSDDMVLKQLSEGWKPLKDRSSPELGPVAIQYFEDKKDTT